MRQYRYVNSLSLRNRLGRLLWEVIWSLFFRPSPRWILNSWRRCLLRAFGARVGKGCRIDPSARIWAPWNLEIGDYVAVAEGVDIYCVSRVSIGSKVTISQRAFLCTASHEIKSLTRPLVHAPINIANHVWVAAEAMVHPGVSVGEGAVIAARGVLRNDAQAWTIWAGNPAREVGKRNIEQDPYLARTEK